MGLHSAHCRFCVTVEDDVDGRLVAAAPLFPRFYSMIIVLYLGDHIASFGPIRWWSVLVILSLSLMSHNQAWIY
jgi:hypothetical protein